MYVSQPGELLPRKNLQVLQPGVSLQGEIDPDELSGAIRRHLEAFDVNEGEADFALAFSWSGAPSYERISAFAQAVTLALKRTIRERRPVYLILDGDIAQTVGAILKEDWAIGSEVLVIDGIALRDFDYIDLGRIRMPSCTVPVTIKSLVFSQDPRLPG
jgi:ethanolamine utilization protein EutA